MEFVLKISAVCIIAAVFSLLIRKSNPEISLLLGVSAALSCLWGGIELFSNIWEYVKKWQSVSILPSDIYIPLLKCLGISIVTQLGCGIAKDSGQAVVSSALELCGNVTAVWCLLPLIDHLITVIEGLL